jgi:predicted nucleic acid-binding protein
VFLVDASVWVGASDPGDRFHAVSSALVLDLERPVAALDLTLYEIANSVGVRRRRPDDARYLSRLLVKRCQGRLVAVDTELIESSIELAAEHGLPAYDASYVAAAERFGWTLVSTDIADLVSKGLAVTPDAADYP